MALDESLPFGKSCPPWGVLGRPCEGAAIDLEEALLVACENDGELFFMQADNDRTREGF